MHRLTAILVALLATLSATASLTVVQGTTSGASAVPVPAHRLAVSGTSVTMYPDFDPAVSRYAVTTTEATAGTVVVDAGTDDPAGTVRVNGAPVTGPTVVSGLMAGEEISVIIDDAGGSSAYAVVYLPAGFPELRATTSSDAVADGYIALTLNSFEPSPLPAFDAIVDRSGVPVYAVPAAQGDLDLKQQPNGEITVSRPTTPASGRTGTDLVTLDDQLAESTRRHMLGSLVNTDGHDAVRMTDGSTLLIGYEPANGRTDATIQKLDPSGAVVFTWDSADLVAETTASSGVQNQNPFAPGDYAHINSIVPAPDGDVIASFRHLSAVLRIATTAHDGYQPGDIVWKLGGRDSDFTFVGDPLGGPCAQHTANLLPNGNILVFDNGSNGLCVNPAAPSGPTLDRGTTRVAEYRLDTTAHTATLVWDYSPADTYALFAGSARRTANGDTLIGWADDRDSLATEVDADGTVLWNLTAPNAPAGHKRYMSYRAELITDLPDAIDPAIDLTGPADGASLVAGDVVSASARCTDRGGSTLRSCATTGISSGRLPTTPGVHTWAATATDGAGNLTTLTRTYVVRAATRAPDGSVRRADQATWKGEHVRGPAARQTVTQRLRRGASASSYWRVRNTGERADAFRLRATAGTARFAAHYFYAGRDVTRAVVAGTFRTPTLAPGAVLQLRVALKPTRTARAGSVRTFTLTAASAADPAAVDRVGIRLTVRR